MTRQVLAQRERLVFASARSHGWPVAFVLAGGYARTDAARRELVELHRQTVAAAIG